MRVQLFLVILIFLVATNCVAPNPDRCCVTDAQCQKLGVDDMRPCEAGQACNAENTCVAKECDTSADCAASASGPACVNGLCEARCEMDEHCAGGMDGSLCAADGACVGCISNSDCTTAAPFCDMTERSCRGCIADDECIGGVCLEADAACRADSDVIFLASSGQDSGECLRGAPCRTFGFAFTKVTPTRTVVHIDGGQIDGGSQPVSVGVSVYFDGTQTAITGGDGGRLFDVLPNKQVTFSGVRLTVAGTAAFGGAGSTVRFHDVSLGRVETSGGSLVLSRVVQTDGFTICASGSLTVTESQMVRSEITSTNCQVALSRTRFEQQGEPCFSSGGGVVTVENSLFVVAEGLTDCMSVSTAAPGSTVRFSTFVNTNSIPSDGVALSCFGGAVEVTSNIFAYNSRRPHSPTVGGCRSTYSLYDEVAEPEQSMGEANKTADGASIFVNRVAPDFHLAAQSPARESAQPGLEVSIDLDGAPRPAPVGTMPDMGAFEAP